MGEGLISSAVGVAIVAVACYIYCFVGNKQHLSRRLKLGGVVLAIYLFSAFVSSFSFSETNFFVVFDCTHYIADYKNVTSISSNELMDTALKSYIDFGDNNALYNIILHCISYVANSYFDGVNSFYYSLLSVLFGVLSSITLYRILSKSFNEKDAFKYTLLFSLLSLYHFYSVVIIRDICITTFYVLSFEVIQSRFSIRGLLLLVLYMLLAWGFRLYSGLFISLFILYYVYIPISQSKLKYVLIPIFGFILAYVIISSMFIIDQTLDEINGFMEYTQDKVDTSGGMSAKLQKLPPGIKQIALVFFTQILPLPPYSYFLEANTLSQYYMALLVFIYGVFWFIVVYTFFYVMAMKKYFMILEMKDNLILLIVLAFIIANTAHPDIRRMMPVYPIIFYYYLKMKVSFNGSDWFILTQKKIVALYCCIILLFNIVKG